MICLWGTKVIEQKPNVGHIYGQIWVKLNAHDA